MGEKNVTGSMSMFDFRRQCRDDRDGTGQWEWKIRNKNAAISRLETGTTSPQGTASTQPYGFVAKASRFQPSGGTPKNVKNWTTFVPLGVPSLSSLRQCSIFALIRDVELLGTSGIIACRMYSITSYE